MKFIVVSLVACGALTSCGKRNTVTIASSDGSCAMHAEEKKKVIKTGKFGWLFSDSEPDWQATHIHFVMDGHQLDLPEKITSRVAEPSELSIEATRTTATNLTISLTGRSASGFNRLILHYKDNHLIEAKTIAVDDDHYTRIYP